MFGLSKEKVEEVCHGIINRFLKTQIEQATARGDAVIKSIQTQYDQTIKNLKEAATNIADWQKGWNERQEDLFEKIDTHVIRQTTHEELYKKDLEHAQKHRESFSKLCEHQNKILDRIATSLEKRGNKKAKTPVRGGGRAK